MPYSQDDPDRSDALRDSTVVCVGKCGRRAPKKVGSRPLDVPLCLRMTGDRTQARALGEAGTDAPQPRLIADRAYDGDAFRAWQAPRGHPL